MRSSLAALLLVAVLAIALASMWYMMNSEPQKPASLAPKPVADENPSPSNEQGQEADDKDERGIFIISGKVADVRGVPQAGAEVRAAKGDKTSTATTNAEGLFTVEGLSRGFYTLTASKDGYQDAHDENVPAGKKQVLLTLGDNGSVSGVVLSSVSGAPVREFEVAAVPAPVEGGEYERLKKDVPWQEVSDQSGRFILNGVLLDTDLLVAARAVGHAIGFVKVSLYRPQESIKDVTIRLTRGRSVEGEVKGPERRPVADAAVYIGEQSVGQPATKTDTRGRFLIDTLTEQDTMVTIAHPDYAAKTVPLPDRPSELLRVVLEKGGGIEGFVRAPTGPMSGLTVEALLEQLPAEGPFTAVTGPDGKYSIIGVPAGVVTLILTNPGGVRVTRDVVLDAGQVLQVDFDLPAASAAVEGLIMCNGQPPEQADIFMQVNGPMGQYTASATVTPDGHYRAEGLLPGTVDMQAVVTAGGGVRQRRNATFEIAEGQTLRQDFEFQTSTVIHGTVSGMKAGERAVVLVLGGEMTNFRLDSIEDFTSLRDAIVAESDIGPDGTYSITGVDPGFYTVVALITGVAAEPGGPMPQVRMTSRIANLANAGDVKIDLVVP